MKRRRIIRKVVPMLIAGALVPLAVTSSPPTLPPAHCFQVRGSVITNGENPAADYTVVVLGRGGYYPPGQWIRLEAYCDPSENRRYSKEASVTDEFGIFSLQVCACDEVDSIAVAVVLPDTVILGDALRVPSLSRIEHEVEHKENGFLCDDTFTVVDYYAYQRVDTLSVRVD